MELVVTNKKNDENVFYLHFELREEWRAKELFVEMLGSLLSLKDLQKTSVLLSCTSAMTTTFFANKLNETAEFLKANYIFDAVSVDQIYDKAYDNDVILIALQIAYVVECLTAVISIVDPEVILIRSDMTPSIRVIREALVANSLKEEYLSEMVRLHDAEMADYVLLGGMILCFEALE